VPLERIPELISRMERLERDSHDLQKLWRSSVDDLKSVIKSEIGDLKNEQIADLRDAIKHRDREMADYENRIRDIENSVRDWTAGRSLLGWLIKTLLGAGGLVAGYFGAKHIG
jgi:chromosome segregation ATPase